MEKNPKLSGKYKIVLSSKSKKRYLILDEATTEKVNALFEVLEDNPVPFKQYDLVKLKGMKSVYRIRIFNYRIIYSVISSEDLIRVLKIDVRQDNTYSKL